LRARVSLDVFPDAKLPSFWPSVRLLQPPAVTCPGSPTCANACDPLAVGVELLLGLQVSSPGCRLEGNLAVGPESGPRLGQAECDPGAHTAPDPNPVPSTPSAPLLTLLRPALPFAPTGLLRYVQVLLRVKREQGGPVDALGARGDSWEVAGRSLGGRWEVAG